MITPQALADVRDAMHRALADRDSADRAQLLELVNRQIMDHVNSPTTQRDYAAAQESVDGGGAGRGPGTGRGAGTTRRGG